MPASQPITHPLVTQVQEQLRLLTRGVTVPKIVIGLSGGPDSVFLFHALLPLHIAGELVLHAAHLNHGWRNDADDDAIFCAKLATSNGIPFHLGHLHEILPTLSSHKQKESSPEARARHCRRAFFQNVLTSHQLDFVILAHHRDDQIATFLLRLIRGTSLSGLCGMQPRAGIYLRPMLAVSKSDLLAVLKEFHRIYCSDATNQDTRFLRNSVTKKLLPAFDSCDKRSRNAIERTMANLQQDEEFISHTAHQSYRQLKNSAGALDLPSLRALHPALQHRVLLQLLIEHGIPSIISTGYLDELLRFILHGRGGTHQICPGFALSKKGRLLSVTATD